jgi:hypothetical protein
MIAWQYEQDEVNDCDSGCTEVLKISSGYRLIADNVNDLTGQCPCANDQTRESLDYPLSWFPSHFSSRKLEHQSLESTKMYIQMMSPITPSAIPPPSWHKANYAK